MAAHDLRNAPVTITLPGEPKGKGRGRATVSKKTGRAFVYSPQATVNYEGMLRDAAGKEMAGRLPMEGAVEVVMLAQFMPAASWSKKKQAAALRGEVMPTKKPDADNLLKCLDALNQIVWRDDAQVVTATVRKRYGTSASLVITAREITSP